jgi:zinc-ribbon domain
MAQLLARFRRARVPEAGEPDAQPQPQAPRRRRLPAPGLLRRERRAFMRLREQRIRDLGGLVLEMYRQDRFRQDLVYEQAAEIVAIEERLFHIDQLLAAAARRSAPSEHCPHCGAPRVPGAAFCASCGRSVAEQP